MGLLNNRCLALSLLLSWCAPLLAADYNASRERLIEAYERQDFPAMVSAAEAALGSRPGYPAALYNLAFAHVLNGQPGASLEVLQKLASMNIDFAVESNDAFLPVKAADGWADFQANIERIRQPVGSASVAYELDQGDFIPEGIGFTADGALLLGSVRYGNLLRIDESGAERTLSNGARAGHWSVFGMQALDDGTAWFASSAVPQHIGHEPEDEGNAGLFRIDVDSGQIRARALLPDDGEEHVLGDVIQADAGTLYTTDSIGGTVLSYDPETGVFASVVEEGKLVSPQGLALDAVDKNLYVADYNGGLFRIALAEAELQPVMVADNLSLYGIDGLYRHGNKLLAIQNGIRPNRVVSLELSDDGLSITGHKVLAMNLPEFDEPTLGVVRGSKFYFVANSHWNRFNRDNELPLNLRGPVILALDLE
jgi:hypothetical protein